MRSVRIAGGLRSPIARPATERPSRCFTAPPPRGARGPQLDGLLRLPRVIAWDEPGSGRSSEPAQNFGLAGYADALARFIEALGFASVHVGGLSWARLGLEPIVATPIGSLR